MSKNIIKTTTTTNESKKYFLEQILNDSKPKLVISSCKHSCCKITQVGFGFVHKSKAFAEQKRVFVVLLLFVAI